MLIDSELPSAYQSMHLMLSGINPPALSYILPLYYACAVRMNCAKQLDMQGDDWVVLELRKEMQYHETHMLCLNNFDRNTDCRVMINVQHQEEQPIHLSEFCCCLYAVILTVTGLSPFVQSFSEPSPCAVVFAVLQLTCLNCENRNRNKFFQCVGHCP